MLGGYDDHHKVADIAQKYGLWHHIDGCWGGYLAFSDKGRSKLFDGAERSDSISINYQKGLAVPVQASVLCTNNKRGALKASATSGADYLFQESEYSDYDIADKTLSCGRKPDGLKIWLCFQHKGLKGMAKIADGALDKAEYITDLIKADSEKFEMTNEPMATNVCFWYTPPCFRGENAPEYTDERKSKVHQMIFKKMQYEGTIMIQQQPFNSYNLPNFFRLTLKGEKTRMEDMPYLLEEIDRMGQDITPESADEFVN